VNIPGAGNRSIRLLLVDDQPAVQRDLKMRFTLEPDLEVIGEAGGVAEAISLARALRPDVVLLDVEMQGTDGISNIAALRQAAPHSVVVIFTLYDDAATRARVREVGAAAFVAKHQTEETLLAAIRRAAKAHREQTRHDGTVEQHGRSGA
jgi:two-component system, NarL family, response regulator DesR